MIDIKDILDAWQTTFNHTEEEYKLAKARQSVCEDCEKIDTSAFLDVKSCSECGCPLIYKGKPIAKLYSKGGCPLKKW